MNPAKRKKLYRLELQKKQLEVKESIQVKAEEKVIQKEEEKVQAVLMAQAATVTSESVEIGLKLPEVESLETKKDKKKKLSSQD